ncbi:NAD(P)/FAD-dependent oxidoreductase [Clostridium botulinum]|uniref:Oxidoreductase, FAD/[2Fe-2S]-binding n=1 Tax=Clostridium botulinum (strain Okra / Type B1) TaxID=498213 RepID=B1IHG4_CLOBK|nr:NAD(P)/FAD-dependent oxidoreductase [Clostridium botulinum]EKX79884.1 oxidoreductase, FAD/[2Fe-2S]-binding protein [Clostridium botulinum CFSAN001628]ACA43952.1 oxidoreductase, FAD/[2Fe-2S]-binding [Clostridium botulinum B1 str. Okra]MBD5563727.1 NAD(P)/FAD-dependent oxidoreductase [Clostridium botulinum]MBD5566690.1 NAD(P)/FAD-dependent oxidoreductase [Clostridium botulinum]MBD5568794.1 NAD(P)/FAD-dependent oxidoreductase [Clostridium botulinum]
MYDVSIIGAGVVGSAIARELSKYNLKVCLIEKEEDVGTGASKANSGIVHGGYVAKYGTLKGELCIRGNSMYNKLEKELNFGYRNPGALVIGFDEDDENRIKKLYENGIKVGCNDLEIIYGDKIKELEPHINKDVKVALYAKSVGVASPYEMTIALAENAIENGIDLKLETKVLAIDKEHEAFIINTNKGEIKSKYIVNAAGLYSDKIANMLEMDDFKILPRRGQYVLSTKDQGYLVNKVIFQVPTEKGKGILVTTTYHGNFMIGPDAQEVVDKEDIGTDIESIEYIIKTARKSIPDFDVRRSLTTFAGIRAISSTGDFVIGETKVKGFINAAGIDSPGLTSSPAIAEKIVGILKESGLQLIKNEKFNPYRKPIIIKKDKSFDGKIDHEDPTKNIICRCEKVTESEIIDAMKRGIPVKSTDAIKRRTRAGMGFCQGNFCRPRVKAIIAREIGIPAEQVTVRGKEGGEPPKRVNINVIRKIQGV